jgi:SAM-dependent methyltransferase
MIRRTSRKNILNLFKQNSNWNILDLGGGKDPFSAAQTVADIVDHSEYFSENHKEKKFVHTKGDKTPFKDKEFDFVIAAHIVEHVPNPDEFLSELTRIAKKGYIEVPTPFFDNLTFGNNNPLPHGHIWWTTFDDDKQELVLKPKLSFTKEILTPRQTTMLTPFFVDSMVIGLLWEDSIEYRKEEAIFEYQSGNSDPKRLVDMTKGVPSGFKKWVMELQFQDMVVSAGKQADEETKEWIKVFQDWYKEKLG